MNAVKFEGWMRDTDVAEHAWTNYLKIGENHADDIEMVVTGKIGNRPPFSCEILATRNGNQVVIYEDIEDDFETACRTAEVQARRAVIRIVE